LSLWGRLIDAIHRADGWHKPSEDEYGGEQMTLKGCTLVRNTKLRRYVYKSTLSKVYGLTASMIEDIGEPDKHRDNPHYRTGPPASLYSIQRVEAWIEANQQLVEKARASRGKRSEAMRERLKAAKEWVRSLPIIVRQPLPSSLLDDAQKWKGNNYVGHADPLQEKALHSYVRHRLTNYEKLLRELYEQELSFELYPLLRERVDAAVKAALVEWQRCEQAKESSVLTHQKVQ
jgi:hypothetical protein